MSAEIIISDTVETPQEVEQESIALVEKENLETSDIEENLEESESHSNKEIIKDELDITEAAEKEIITQEYTSEESKLKTQDIEENVDTKENIETEEEGGGVKKLSNETEVLKLVTDIIDDVEHTKSTEDLETAPEKEDAEYNLMMEEDLLPQEKKVKLVPPLENTDFFEEIEKTTATEDAFSLTSLNDEFEIQDKTSPKSIATTSKCVEPEEDSIYQEPEQIEPPSIDRDLYYEIYDTYYNQQQQEKIKNYYLQKKMTDYFRNKKMPYVLKEDIKTQLDAMKKYEQEIEKLDQFMDYADLEKSRIHNEMADLSGKICMNDELGQSLFQQLQESEVEMGKEAISHLPEPGHAEKVKDRYLRKQRNEYNNLMKIRLNYIEMRNRVNAKQQAVDALDNLGPNLRLADYEQLKFDNTNHRDRMEEKDLELNQIRAKCRSITQILAHKREKTKAVEEDIENLKERLETISFEHEDIREDLNNLKIEKGIYRKFINKLQEKSGLLTRPKLLQDMEMTNMEVEILSKELADLKTKCRNTEMQLELFKRKSQVISKKETNSGSSCTFLLDNKN